MEKIITEVIIPQGTDKTVFSPQRVQIRINDLAAGPFLIIEGFNEEPGAGESAHEFCLQSIEEINQFAAICRRMLRSAEEK
jgi:hypothetical protein